MTAFDSDMTQPMGEGATNDSRTGGDRGRLPSGKKKELPTYIKHRRREPGEVVTRSAAIQAFCRECVGWDSDGCGSVAGNVRSCACEECWLHPWRNGKLDDGNECQGTEGE